MSVFFELKVNSITRETEQAVCVTFETPNQLTSEFKFVPGQYVTIRKTINGEELRRAYSICSYPNQETFSVAIKAVDKGRFSVYANTKLKEGDILEVAAPEGKFVVNTDDQNTKKYMAFAAGSGITPIMAMVKSVLKNEPNSKFVLVYGNKSSDQTIFKQELDQLAEHDAFDLHYVNSQKLSDKALFGRINQDIYHKIVKGVYAHESFDEYLLCGPETMINTISEALQNDGVSQDKIKYELFTTTSTTSEIEEDLSGNTKLTVLLDDEETELEMRKDELILDAALAKGLDAPYSCQGGICSSCMAKVTEGKVVMEKNTILNEDEVAEGLILTCQAHPVSQTVKIDYDDV